MRNHATEIMKQIYPERGEGGVNLLCMNGVFYASTTELLIFFI